MHRPLTPRFRDAERTFHTLRTRVNLTIPARFRGVFEWVPDQGSEAPCFAFVLTNFSGTSRTTALFLHRTLLGQPRETRRFLLAHELAHLHVCDWWSATMRSPLTKALEEHLASTLAGAYLHLIGWRREPADPALSVTLERPTGFRPSAAWYRWFRTGWADATRRVGPNAIREVMLVPAWSRPPYGVEVEGTLARVPVNRELGPYRAGFRAAVLAPLVPTLYHMWLAADRDRGLRRRQLRFLEGLLHRAGDCGT